MKATDLLKKQHRVVLGLFAEIERSKKPAKQQALVEALGRELITHMVIEEQVVYPKASRILRGKMALDINEVFEEHMSAKVALARLLVTPPEHAAFAARVKVLKELLKLHIKDEETVLFVRLNKMLAAKDNTRMLDELQALAQHEMEQDPLRRVFGETLAPARTRRIPKRRRARAETRA